MYTFTCQDFSDSFSGMETGEAYLTGYFRTEWNLTLTEPDNAITVREHLADKVPNNSPTNRYAYPVLSVK